MLTVQGFGALSLNDDVVIPNSKNVELEVPPPTTQLDDFSGFVEVKKKTRSRKTPKAPPKLGRYWELMPEPEIHSVFLGVCFFHTRFQPSGYLSVALLCKKALQIVSSFEFWRDCLLRARFVQPEMISVLHYNEMSETNRHRN